MPVSDCEVRDPRIRRTRQMLHAALRALMFRHSFDEISVQDITDEATISRATFYDHYTDKYSLLAAMVAGEFLGLLRDRNVRYEGAGSEGALILAVFDFLHASHSNGVCEGHSAFEPLIDVAIVEAIQKVLRNGPPMRDEIAPAAAGWLIYGAAREWLKKPGNPSAKEFVAAVESMVQPMLGTAEKPAHAR